MTPDSWQAAYYGELQTLWSLCVVPFAFLAWRLATPVESARAVVPGAARFVAGSTLAFAVLTIVDPIATGPLVKQPALRGSFAATVIPFFFVYLGDLRVLWTAFAVAHPEATAASTFARAAAATAIVPVATGLLYAALRALAPDAHSQWLWMIYEAGFLALCAVAGRRLLPRLRDDHGRPLAPAARSFLQSLFGYSAAYYALWLAADVVIVMAGQDLGWALRMAPNQLYYAFWTPFVYFRFFPASGGSEPNAAQ